jgi:hypothetical protein
MDHHIMQKKISFLDQGISSYFKLIFGHIDPERFLVVPFDQAEYLFFSQYNPDHHAVGPDTVKVMITGENLCPDFNTCDYAISSEYLELGDRHLRVPVYATYNAAKNLADRPQISAEELRNKTKFCNFIYSNSRLAHPFREQFFHALNRVIPVASAGRILRNDNSLSGNDTTTDWGAEKRKFVEEFRFTIAIENSEQPGYCTEKISDALLAHTIPIYWGDPRITEEFNSKAFLHLRDYADKDEATAYIQNLNLDLDRQLTMLNLPVFAGGIDRVEKYITAARAFMENIFDQPRCTARRRPRHGCMQGLEARRRKDQKGLKRRLKWNRT